MRRSVIILIFSVFVLAISGCEDIQNAIYKSAIEKALHEDALTGKAPTPEHAAAMRQVALNDCPQDFRVAYMNHIHAWDETAAVNQAKVKIDNEEDAAALGGALATLFDSDATPWSDHLRAQQEIVRYEKLAATNVATTWQEVETIASKYGARVPQ
jgi:hypothetical protein